MSGSLGTLDFPRLDIAPDPNPLQAYVDQANHLHGFIDRLGDQPQVAPAQPVVAGPTLAQGVSTGAGMVGDYVAAQRADAATRGLWNDETGLPTGAGLVEAAKQYGSGILMGTTAPGAKAVPGQLSLFDRPPEPVPLPEPAPAPPPNVLTAYHGTPHLFDPTEDNPLGAFRDLAIGSGEGAQAFGYGHYLAENENTARQYRDALSAGPTFDLSGTGGPEGRFGVAQTKDLLTGFLEDHPMLEDHPLEAVERGTHWAVEGVAEGKPIDQLHQEADAGGWSQYHKDAAHSALEFLSDAKVDPGVPTVGGKPYDPRNPAHKAAQIVDTHGGDTQAALADIDRDLASAQAMTPATPSRSSAYYADTVRGLTEMRGMIADGSVGKYKAPGHMLETQIAGSPEEFLHWDRPLSEQPDKIVDAVADLAAKHGIQMGNATGARAYQELTSKLGGGVSNPSTGYVGGGDPAAASQALSDAGIKGIRYLDAGSRNVRAATPQQIKDSLSDISYYQDLLAGQGPALTSSERIEAQSALRMAQQQHAKLLAQKDAGGTHNYVVFSPRNIRIIRRYGIAGLTGGGAAALAAQGQSAQQ